MNYKIVKIASFYYNFLDYYYEKNQEIKKKSYKEQYNDIMNEGFGWANFYQIHLNELGNEAYEIIYNADSLQRAWAQKMGINKSGDELLIEQLKYLKPDVVFFQDSMHFSPKWIEEIKYIVPSIKLTIGWCCSPFTQEHLKLFSKFDIMLGCSPLFVDIFKKNNIKSYELNHAFESNLLSKLEKNNNYPNSDVIFIGSFRWGKDFHIDRLNLIEKLIRNNFDLKLYANIAQDKYIKSFLTKAGYLYVNSMVKTGLSKMVYSNDKLKKLANLTEVPKRMKFSKEFLASLDNTKLFGLEMMKAITKSKIGLNIHGGVAGTYAANIRLFEVTGVGACLVTDWKQNIKKFFIPDEEILTYKNIEECNEKVKYLLSHPEKRKMIAEAGHRRTLSEHTFEKRARQLDEIIKDNFNCL